MQNTTASTCKLPLLDGEGDSTAKLIATPVELDQVDKLQGISKTDRASLNTLLCTAWGLLLRCYVGQERISFYFSTLSNGRTNHESASQRFVFGLELHDEEPLSEHIIKAKSAFYSMEQAKLSQLNTAVCVQYHHLPKSNSRDEEQVGSIYPSPK